jgi:hypothetical protein
MLVPTYCADTKSQQKASGGLAQRQNQKYDGCKKYIDLQAQMVYMG